MFATHAEIIEKIGVAVLAAALGLPQSHIRTMKARNSIPTRHWSAAVRTALDNGIDGVTHETLAEIAASETMTRDPTPTPAPASEQAA